jgi:TonB family protein
MLNLRNWFLLLALVSSILFPTRGPVFASRSPSKAPQSSGAAPKTTDAPLGGLVLLTDTEGVNFDSYLTTVYRSVRDKWREGMPPSAKSGEQGRNVVQFRIMQDGKIPEDFLKLVYSSGKKDMDEASLESLRKAAPFSHLPDKFSQPFIELRVTFAYNLSREKSR